MLALEIKNYIIGKKSVSLGELAAKFDMDYDNMRSLLNIWVKQGKLRHSPAVGSCCSNGRGCGSCTLINLEFYDWV